MSLQLIVNPEAEADLSQAQDWYAQQRAGLGDRFLMSVEAVFDRICRRPDFYWLDIRGTSIDVAGRQRLMELLPNCRLDGD